MKLDIDLNKLSIDELKLVVAMAEKQEQKEPEDEVASDEPKETKESRYSNFSRRTWNKSEIDELKQIAKEQNWTKKNKMMKAFARKTKRTINSVKGYVYRHLGIIYRQQQQKTNVLRWSDAEINGLKDLCDKGGNRYENVREGLIEYAKKIGRSIGSVKANAYIKRFIIPETEEIKPKIISFPEFEMVAEDYRPILQDMLQNIAKSQRLQMSYMVEGKILDMNMPDWKDLCASIITNSDKIAKYFNIDNKYKLGKSYDELPTIMYY